MKKAGIPVFILVIHIILIFPTYVHKLNQLIL